ncbi:MAG: decaprenyl-phosphate phosphoribosyltransferase [Promethearchaeota archaeon]
MAGKLKSLVRLLRVRQWYKNAVVLVGPIFAGRLFDFTIYAPVILGVALCCGASSFNYVVNDLLDLDSDRAHPEKAKSRPLASGDLPVVAGVLLAVALLAFSVGVPLVIGSVPVLVVVFLIVGTGQLYNFVLKHHAFVDVITLAMIYIWRAVLGCYIVEIFPSPWLFVEIFLVALFLVVCKRKADLDLLGEAAGEHKRVYRKYDETLLNQLITVISSALFITYCLYAILGPFEGADGTEVVQNKTVMIFSIPFALYMIMRYLSLLATQPEVARRPERAFLDRGLLIGGSCLLVVVLAALYIDPQFFSIFYVV